MMKINKHIQILRTTLPNLSSLSLESCRAIQAVLERYYQTVGVSYVNSLEDLDSLIAIQPDLVFMGAKYITDSNKRKIWLSDYLTQNKIEHTGSKMPAIRLEQSKPLAKQQIQRAGLKTPDYTAHYKGEPVAVPESMLPVFIKPACLGGGQGIDESSVAHTQQQVASKVASLAAVDILVEQYLAGREFSVAILRSAHSQNLIAMPIELTAPQNSSGDRILGQNVKSANSEAVNKLNDPLVQQKVCQLAIAAFEALGARDYGRIDIRMDAAGQPYFLEANLIPSLIDNYGSFPKACQLNVGMGYEAMILQIVKLGLGRHPLTRISSSNLLKSSGIHAVVAQW